MALWSQYFKKSESDSHYSQVMRRSIYGFCFLLTLLFVVTGAVLAYVAIKENRHQINHSQVDALKAIETCQDKIGTALTDYAFWNDAYRYT